MTGLKVRLTQILDDFIIWTSDAARWFPAMRPHPALHLEELTESSGEACLSLDRSDVFIARLPVQTDDPFEAAAAYEMQADRLSPLDRTSVTCDVAPDREGDWYVAFVRNSLLSDMRSKAHEIGASVEAFRFAGAGGLSFVFRGEEEMQLRRGRALQVLVSCLVFSASILACGVAIAFRSDTALAVAQAERRDAISQVRILGEERARLQSTSHINGMEPDQFIVVFDRIAGLRPANWTVVQWRFQSETITIQFELPQDSWAEADAFQQAIAGQAEFVGVTINRRRIQSDRLRAEMEIEMRGDGG